MIALMVSFIDQNNSLTVSNAFRDLMQLSILKKKKECRSLPIANRKFNIGEKAKMSSPPTSCIYIAAFKVLPCHGKSRSMEA